MNRKAKAKILHDLYIYIYIKYINILEIIILSIVFERY